MNPPKPEEAAGTLPESEPDAWSAALQGLRALLGDLDSASLALLLDLPARDLQALPGASAGPAAPAGSASDAAALRRWRRSQPQRFDAVLTRAIAWLQQQGRVARAAELALAWGWPELQLQLLREAGWRLLFSPDRPLLGALLAPLRLHPALDGGELLGLRLAWTIEAQGEPHTALRLLTEAETGAALDPALLAVLQGRIALAFDQPARAVQQAQAAIRAYPHDLSPPALLARCTLGQAWLAAGHPEAALAPLSAALKGADRDDLALLRLEALRALGRCHGLLAQAEPAAFYSAAAEALHRSLGLADPQQPLPEDSYHAFPQLLDRAEAHLRAAPDQAGQLAAATALVEALQQRERQRFYCYPWRNRLLQAQIWLASLRQQTAELRAQAGLPSLAQALPQEPAPAADEAMPAQPHAKSHLFELERAVLRASAALLAAAPLPPDRLLALAEELRRRPLPRLARRLALIQALGSQPADLDGLRDWLLHEDEADPLDGHRLAPKLVGPLVALLASTAIVHHPKARMAARQWLERLRGRPLEAGSAGPAGGATAGPLLQGAALLPGRSATAIPLDLTGREWQVLQLIGQALSNEQIAAQLFIALPTVKTHINRLYAKLQIGSREEAMQRARTACSAAGGQGAGGAA